MLFVSCLCVALLECSACNMSFHDYIKYFFLLYKERVNWLTYTAESGSRLTLKPIHASLGMYTVLKCTGKGNLQLRFRRLNCTRRSFLMFCMEYCANTTAIGGGERGKESRKIEKAQIFVHAR